MNPDDMSMGFFLASGVAATVAGMRLSLDSDWADWDGLYCAGGEL